MNRITYILIFLPLAAFGQQFQETNSTRVDWTDVPTTWVDAAITMGTGDDTPRYCVYVDHGKKFIEFVGRLSASAPGGGFGLNGSANFLPAEYRPARTIRFVQPCYSSGTQEIPCIVRFHSDGTIQVPALQDDTGASISLIQAVFFDRVKYEIP